MADESPLCCSEEGVGFHIGGTSAGPKAAVLIFDQEFSDEGFAEAIDMSAGQLKHDQWTYLEI